MDSVWSQKEEGDCKMGERRKKQSEGCGEGNRQEGEQKQWVDH